jgi:hypothetical protein
MVECPRSGELLGGSQLGNPLAEMDKAVANSGQDQFTKPLMQLDKDGPNLHPSMLRKWLIWRSKIGFSRYYRWLLPILLRCPGELNL